MGRPLTQEQRDKWNANRRARLAALTPQERRAYLKSRRQNYKRRCLNEPGYREARLAEATKWNRANHANYPESITLDRLRKTRYQVRQIIADLQDKLASRDAQLLRVCSQIERLSKSITAAKSVARAKTPRLR